MLRRGLVAVPLLAAAAAFTGARLADRAWLAVGIAVLAGLAVQGGLDRTVDRRIERVAERIKGFAEGDVVTRIHPEGSSPRRRLVRALNAVGASLERQFDELAAERVRAERLLEQLPLAVLLFTEHGLAYANPAARELFTVLDSGGRTPRQVLGVTALADAVAETGETGRSVEVEVTRAERVLSARAVEPTPGEVALLVTDLTEARRVDEVRRDFVVNASHELKTPVAGLRALADSIQMAVERDPPRARRMIARLREEADRLSQMVRDLLDLARLEEAVAHRNRRAVDVAAAVRHGLDRFRQQALECRVALAAECPHPAAVVALPEDVRLIVDNLIGNAVRYNREGGRVDVAVRRRTDAVLLEVRDTGIGIPAADQDRIFERFYRVDKARTRASGGTGLGLSLVRNAVQRQGGSLTVESVLGEGSVFRAVLPVEGAVVDEQHARRRHGPGHPGGAGLRDRKGPS